MTLRGMPLLTRYGGAAALQPLQQATQIRGGMDAEEEVQVCADHANLEDPSALLMRHTTKKTTQESGEPSIDQGLAVAGRPDDVAVETVDHARNLYPLR